MRGTDERVRSPKGSVHKDRQNGECKGGYGDPAVHYIASFAQKYSRKLSPLAGRKQALASIRSCGIPQSLKFLVGRTYRFGCFSNMDEAVPSSRETSRFGFP
jgi:hypothetical protein